MFQYKMLKTDGLDANAIDSLKNKKKDNVIYFFHPTKAFFAHLKALYDLEIDDLLYEEKEADYEIKSSLNQKNIVKLLLIYPKERTEEDIERMVDSLVILKFEETTFVITQEKEAFISDFLKSCSRAEMTDGEILIGLLNAALDKMSTDARKIRKQITSIEASINTSGPVRPIFNNLLQLKKHLITLALTYDSNDKLIEFFKREKELLNLKTKGNNGIIKLEENLETLKKLVKSYDDYLGDLDVMITNLSSFQLNRIMKTLTEISIVLTIPTMVYGFWGINVKLPFQGMFLASLWVLLVSIGISSIVWIWIKSKKFL